MAVKKFVETFIETSRCGQVEFMLVTLDYTHTYFHGGVKIFKKNHRNILKVISYSPLSICMLSIFQIIIILPQHGWIHSFCAGLLSPLKLRTLATSNSHIFGKTVILWNNAKRFMVYSEVVIWEVSEQIILSVSRKKKKKYWCFDITMNLFSCLLFSCRLTGIAWTQCSHSL